MMRPQSISANSPHGKLLALGSALKLLLIFDTLALLLSNTHAYIWGLQQHQREISLPSQILFTDFLDKADAAVEAKKVQEGDALCADNDGTPAVQNEDEEGDEGVELCMPRLFDFEDKHKSFVFIEKIKLFIHAEVGYLKKDIIVEHTDSHLWVEHLSLFKRNLWIITHLFINMSQPSPFSSSWW